MLIAVTHQFSLVFTNFPYKRHCYTWKLRSGWLIIHSMFTFSQDCLVGIVPCVLKWFQAKSLKWNCLIDLKMFIADLPVKPIQITGCCAAWRVRLNCALNWLMCGVSLTNWFAFFLKQQLRSNGVTAYLKLSTMPVANNHGTVSQSSWMTYGSVTDSLKMNVCTSLNVKQMKA